MGSTSDGSASAPTSTDAGGSTGAEGTSSTGPDPTAATTTTTDPTATGEGTTGEGFCVAHTDCAEGEVCQQFCDDWCDQSMFPNPCCERACVALSPFDCESVLGTCDDACPRGTYAAENQEVWSCAAQVLCCLPTVKACADLPNRFTCESLSICQWVLADCEVENCSFPDKGACQPK